jgi:hypothetical protein
MRVIGSHAFLRPVLVLVAVTLTASGARRFAARRTEPVKRERVRVPLPLVELDPMGRT